MKLKYEGFEFEDLTAEEAGNLVRSLKEPTWMVQAPTLDTGTEWTRQASPRAEVTVPDPKKRPVRKNPNSLFYATDRKHFRPDLADTYDYVASYKNGPTVTDVATKFGIRRTCANQRLAAFTREGLLRRVGRGRYVTAYPEEGFINATPEQITLPLGEKAPC